jgi:parallel beta-helix repeat protein
MTKFFNLLCLIIIAGFCLEKLTADPGTAFTYQGRLADGTTPIENAVDLQFSLWDAATSGTQVGSDITISNTAYDDGIVVTDLDFGVGAFNGDPRWLEVELRNPTDPSDTQPYTVFGSRNQLAPTPYAMYSETVASVVGGTDDADADSANELNSSLSLNGSIVEVTDTGGTLSADLSSLDGASRTAINSLPFTISTPGSYYLTTSLSAAAGISITANNVTLDLNGFALQNTAGDGIVVSSAENVVIKNGFVRECGGDGIDASGSTFVTVKAMKVIANTLTGIRLGNDSLALNNTVHRNLEHGIRAGTRCVVRENDLRNNSNSNTEAGILVSGSDNIIEDNTVLNGRRGISVSGTRNRLARNFAKGSSTIIVLAARDYLGNIVIEADGNYLDLLIAELPFGMPFAGKATVTGNLQTGRNDEPGITINSDNVTIDLNGFAIIGLGEGGTTDIHAATLGLDDPPDTTGDTRSSSDGIYIAQQLGDIIIRDGTIRNWGGEGIDGFARAFNCQFEDLILTANDRDGLSVDSGNIIRNCIARLNGIDGFDGDTGNTYIDCLSAYNGGDGFQSEDSIVITRCHAANNGSDGFDLGSGATITHSLAVDNSSNGFNATSSITIEECLAEGNGLDGFNSLSGSSFNKCVAHDNTVIGFDTSSAGGHTFRNCLATFNDLGGFEIGSASLVENCVAYQNGDDTENSFNTLGEDYGFSVGADSTIRNCLADSNGNAGAGYAQDGDGAGINIFGIGTLAVENHVTDNVVGIRVSSSQGSFIMSNSASGNTTNYFINANNRFGPIVNVTSVGAINGTANANNPWANFEF